MIAVDDDDVTGCVGAGVGCVGTAKPALSGLVWSLLTCEACQHRQRPQLRPDSPPHHPPAFVSAHHLPPSLVVDAHIPHTSLEVIFSTMAAAQHSTAYGHHLSSPLGDLSDDNMAIDSDSESSSASASAASPPRRIPQIKNHATGDSDVDVRVPNDQDADADADADGDADAEADPDYADDDDDNAQSSLAVPAHYGAPGGSRLSSKVRFKPEPVTLGFPELNLVMSQTIISRLEV